MRVSEVSTSSELLSQTPTQSRDERVVLTCVRGSVRQVENEKDHRVRMGVGNGLRQDVWREFHRRFGEIPMCEIYGSTEGNLCFMNHIGKIGAVGRSNFFYKVSRVECM